MRKKDNKKYEGELIDLYINKGYTNMQLAEKYGKSPEAIRKKLSRLNAYKLKGPSRLEELSLENKSLKKELEGIKKSISYPNALKYKPVELDFPQDSLKFLAFGDCHMGHKEYRPDIFNKMLEDAKREKCQFAINCGDTIEGMSGRDGHIFELNKVGATDQIDYFKEEFSKVKKVLGKDFKVYSIESTGSHGGWYGSKGNMGLDIGKELQKSSDNYVFLGYDEQDLVLKNGLKIRMRHPGGGTAYAISYKMQKYVEGISGGQKPHLVFQGHFHKANYIHYRNVHCYDVGTLENQSIFMRKIGTPAHLGYWIVEVKLNKSPKDNGKLVERVTNTFVPFFE